MKEPFENRIPRGFSPRRRFFGDSRIRHIAWSPDGSKLAAGFANGAVRIWDLATGSMRMRDSEKRVSVSNLCWSAEGRALAASYLDQSIWLWDAESLDPLNRVNTNASCILGIAWSSDGKRINAAGVHGSPPQARLRLQSWDANTAVENEAYSDARWAEAFTAVSEDRRLLALSFKDETIQVLDLRTWGHGVKFEGPYCDLYGVALSPDSQLAAIALEDNSIHIWDRKMSQKLLVLNDATDHVYSITFSHDSRYLAAKSKDGYVRVWSCSTWERTSLLAEESVGQEYVEIAFNPRCLSLATYANKNTALQIWDINPVAVKGELEMSRILFLAAEPVDIPTPLRVDVESREITEKLKLGEYGNSFDVVFEMATRPEDLTRALINKRPHYVHFSGHGTKNGALCLLNKNNETHLVRPESLARIFKPFSKQVICVILSACFSEPQALAIAEHVDYVIGMNKEIGDKSAIAFAVGFYQAIGGNLTVEDAFDLGCGQIDVQNLPDHLVPVLIRKRA